VNYEDEEKELDRQIQAELGRRKGGHYKRPPSFSNSKELQALLKHSPVRKIVRNLPLSSYIRQVRTSLGATTEVFAAALNQPVATVQQLESKQMLPWTIDPQVVAQVAESLRLHVTALQVLSKHSHTIAFVSRQLLDPDLARQQMLDWLEEVKAELDNRGAVDLLQ